MTEFSPTELLEFVKTKRQGIAQEQKRLSTEDQAWALLESYISEDRKTS